MISRARELAERPIADRERSRLFVAATAVLVLTAAVLLAVGRDEEQAVTPVPSTSPPAAEAPADPEPPAVPWAAERAARRFLRGYLSFLYGRSGPAAIEPAAHALRREIVRSRPRVPPAGRRRRPRVATIGSEARGAGAVAVSAQIADGGVSRYTITLRLRWSGGRWVVVAVGGD